MQIRIDDHPLLEVRAFISEFPRRLGEIQHSLPEPYSLDAHDWAQETTSDELRAAVRDLLRFGGFKPTGRSKPSSEYLLKAAAEKRLQPINFAVDLGNAISLHSGLPISVVDVDRLVEPLHIGVAKIGASYVFNPSGQTIDVGGLICLIDAEGPCANAVKDAQRTKTDGDTTRTLSILWSSQQLPGRAAECEMWYHSLLTQVDVTVRPCVFER